MAVFNVWRAETTSATMAYYFSNSAEYSATDGLTYIDYATTTNYNGGVGPWNVVLYQETLDGLGNIVTSPFVVQTYTVPATDPNTGAIFHFFYESGHISNTETGLFWTVPTNSTYGPTDQTTVMFQPFNAAGTASTGPAIALQLHGTTAPVTDLYDVSLGFLASYGSNFIVVYSTYNPSNHATTINFEEFTDAGAPVTGGQIVGFNDGSHHGVAFGTYYGYNDVFTGQTPAYALIYRLPTGGTSGVQVYILNPNGSTRDTFELLDYGPGGLASSTVYDYGFSAPSPTIANQDYGVFTQTFAYTDANSVKHIEIEIETVTAIGATSATIGATTEFEDVNGTETGVGVARVEHGDFVIAYDDGGQTYLKEYNSSLTQIGATLALPNDNDGFESLSAIGDGRVLVEWRQSVSGGYVQHSIVYGMNSTVDDYNDDGVSDVLFGNSKTGAYVDWSVVNGAFSASHSVGSLGAGTAWSFAGTGDFNGDGTADILFQNVSGALTVWQLSNGTHVSSPSLGVLPAGYTVVGTGDFNGDGASDVLLYDAATGAVADWLVANGVVSAKIAIGASTPSAGWRVVGTGDFNGDGTTDILWQNANSHELLDWQMSAGKFSSQTVIGTPGAAWTYVATGDFNGDGTADLLFESTTGALADWQLKNGAFSAAGSPGIVVPTGFTVAKTGDFNGDGVSDVLISNSTTGQVEDGIFSGGHIAQWTSIGTAAPSVGWGLKA